jgi:hypothetical protein
MKNAALFRVFLLKAEIQLEFFTVNLFSLQIKLRNNIMMPRNGTE